MDLQYDVSTSLGFGGTQMITSTGMRSLRLLRLALVLLQRHNMKSFRWNDSSTKVKNNNANTVLQKLAPLKFHFIL